MKKILAASVIILPLLAGAAYADHDSVRAMANTKISLVDAIQAAERDQGGKAYEASIDDDSNRPVYDVSIMKDGKVYEVEVDAVNGAILNTYEDIDD